ncbi:MAG TPA: 16S rRNA (adenine(1518)-N(6)/adenine(1519)-N(6))-dimethyltransferase RsmA [Terracidiphilus sp.]|nr:16S rRNA (adenine(1518)-N(6)/adenine(1519)-N(6))-dimethyltransferase RsmA [Terracidiphilus sp.]
MPAKPKLGQNFLRDTQAIERIVAALGDCSSHTVVEVGPGRGALTRILAAHAAHVLAIELDAELASELQSEFPPDRVTVVNEDVLSFRFTEAAAQTGQRLLVVGNLPYYITSPILLKLAANHAVLDRAVLMVQREVADRVAAEPGSRDYGLLTVTTQLYGSIEKLFTLPPSAFSPPPEVHSTVFRWRFAPRVRELDIDETGFVAFLRRAFAQKRKTLVNNLRAAGFAAPVISAALSSVQLNPRARAEELDLATFAALFRALNAERAAPQNEAARSVPDSSS